MNITIRRVRTIRAKFRVGQHVRISKEIMKYTKGAERNFSWDIYRIKKIINKIVSPFHELEELNKTPIEGQFYQEELTPVRIFKHNTYKTGKY